MRELVFQVEFKSDIVLTASSNTEGKIDQLDFIAGSNFLGMVAKNYSEFVNSFFDVFHSGKVRFGDGHILKDGKMTYKIPYSYFHKKLETTPIFNHHFLDDKDFENLGQLKQLREGFITKDKGQVFVDYTYSQKSAYDKKNRRSLDSNMYGYKAIKKGSAWQFTVKVDAISKEDEQLIIKTLQESTRLGKSKSAEYGEVKIKYLENQARENLGYENLQLGEVVLYCNSRLALVDECGNPTYDLKYLCDGIEINYDKTQIRISTFTPYNGARKTKDYERVCINKGSVIVLKNATQAQLDQIQNGVGAFLSEGFGEIFINPSFLMEKKFELQKDPKDEKPKDKREKIDIQNADDTVLFLQNRHNENINMLDIANEVAAFVDKHKKSELKNIKPSQWGNIRSIASSNKEDFIENIKTYISNGAKKWEEKQVKTLMDAISNHKINKQKFTKLLAMKMGGKND